MTDISSIKLADHQYLAETGHRALKVSGTKGRCCGGPPLLCGVIKAFIREQRKQLLNFQTCTGTPCDDYGGLKGDSPESCESLILLKQEHITDN